MTLNELMRQKQYDKIWQKYCGFLDLSLNEYLDIQRRLLLEQIELYSECELGRRIMQGEKPTSVEEFRQLVPLTTYDDYADILLPKIETALPVKPALWIQTTWEGAKKPIKVAPYTPGMIKNHMDIFLTIVILATSDSKGQFSLRKNENFLYGMAPLPYLTGIVPHLISDDLLINFLPPTKQAEAMSFSERNQLGFKMGMQKGIDLFFGLSSVISRIGDSFVSGSKSGGGFSMLRNSPRMNLRLARAAVRAKKENRPVMPKDVWKLKGLICSGTDSAVYKQKIQEQWGIKPLEIFGGTEPTCIATETWSKNGLVFFPDVCFYEFIPKSEYEKNIDDPSYVPQTYLLNELVAGEKYELVITNFKGGAFARYRVGDIFRCVFLKNEEEGIDFPQFVYVDREPQIIDIGGFTRISENTVKEALELSKLAISDWFAAKEFDSDNKPYLHLYVEASDAGIKDALTRDIIKEHLSIYFRYVDDDYSDLKKLLGMDPLEVSILPQGTIAKHRAIAGRKIRRMNPSPYDVVNVKKIASGSYGKEVG